MDFESEPATPSLSTTLGNGTVASWLDQPPGSLLVRSDEFVDPTNPELVAWLTAVVRFTRPDGSVILDQRGRMPARLMELERWARRVGDPSLARVIGWWRPSSSISSEVGWIAPPLPTATWLDRPLAILRPDWTARGDWLAINHQTPGSRTTIEVAGRGVSWLSQDWTSPDLGGDITPAQAIFASTGPFADAYEWAFGIGPTRVTRTAILVRGAGLAILMQTEEDVGAGLGEVRWTLPPGIEARSDSTLRTLVLSSGRGRPIARLIPLGLPESSYPTDRGSLQVDGNEVVLRQQSTGPNRCLALMVSWAKKPPRGWRTLTVAEKSTACPPGTAFAVRIGWGVGRNGLIIYKSLGPSGLRSLLGHQTKARFLVGGLSPTGDVHPWVKTTSEPSAVRPE